jgi:hypothetical protein
MGTAPNTGKDIQRLVDISIARFAEKTSDNATVISGASFA